MNKTDRALEYFHEKKYQEALELFQEVANKKPSSETWFNVATCAVLAGETALGFDSLLKARNLCDQNSGSLSFSMMQYYFILSLRDAGEFDKAFEVMNALKGIFEELYITDDNFLYMRGLPFFSEFLDKTLPILQHFDTGKSKEWLLDLASKVDAEGNQIINNLLAKNF